MILRTTRPDTLGRGLASGFDHVIRYVSRLSDNGAGINGNSWVVRSLPYLHYGSVTVDGKPEEVALVQGLATRWIWEIDAYQGQKGTRKALTIAGNGDFVVAGPRGEQWVFYGPDAVTGLRGRMKTHTLPNGLVETAAYLVLAAIAI